MNFLVIGSGGREHALVWALSQSQHVETIHVAPGNAGMSNLATLHKVDVSNNNDLLSLANSLHPDVIIIGPEVPLVNGAADVLRENGFTVFGSGSKGAQLEGSKIFAKQFMLRNAIPTAPFDVCTTVEEAQKALDKRTAPFVVKADGLAAGKGAFVLKTKEDALTTVSNLLVKKELGVSGEKIVVEDFMPGLELTVLCISDGKSYRILPCSQDHKRVFDNDEGPNTGGMGAYSPVPWVGKELLQKIEEKIILPTFMGLQSEKIPFCGILYFGLMIDNNGSPRVVEYNVRFGDPEAEVILPLLSVDFAELINASCNEELDTLPEIVSAKWAVDVVMSSGGYPGPYTKGLPITGLDKVAKTDNVMVFHAGTALNEKGEIVTAGGRVLNVIGIGDTLDEALKRSYDSVAKIHFEGAHYRNDITAKARRGVISMNAQTPRVGIVLGSKSDLPAAHKAADILKQFEIPFEVTIASAHRTPEDAAKYASLAEKRGIEVLIAMAGLSAALPGVLAAHTLLPVIGVPISAGTLGGLDALLSIAQMPPGVPVAATGIDGAKNASLMAIRILARQDDHVKNKLSLYMKEEAQKIQQGRESIVDLPVAPSDAFAEN